MLQIPVSGVPPFMALHLAGVDPLDDQHQFIPEGFNRRSAALVHIDDGKVKVTFFEPQVVDHQAAALHVQYLHRRARLVDKDERTAVADVHTHLVGHNPVQSMETFAHVAWIRVQVITVRFVQAEHADLFQKDQGT